MTDQLPAPPEWWVNALALESFVPYFSLWLDMYEIRCTKCRRRVYTLIGPDRGDLKWTAEQYVQAARYQRQEHVCVP